MKSIVAVLVALLAIGIRSSEYNKNARILTCTIIILMVLYLTYYSTG